MKNLLTGYSLVVLTSILIGLSSCVTVNPVNDTVNPDLSIYLKQSGPAILIANSDPARQPTALGCPIGTFYAGQNTNSYFLDLPQTVGINVVSSDKGAVRDMSIQLSGSVVLAEGDVSGVTAINDPDAEIEVTQINPAEVEINVVFKNLRTAQIVTFEVATNNEGLIVRAESSDFSNNRISLPFGNSGGTDHGGQIIDIGVCE